MQYASEAAQISRYYEFTWPKGTWHDGLGLLPASEYLERRSLWIALSELATLEHPGLLMGGRQQPSIVARVWAGEPQVSMAEFDDPFRQHLLTPEQKLPYSVRRPARTQILRTLRDEWDATKDRETSRERQREVLAQHYGVPVETIAEPLYLEKGTKKPPMGRVRALETYASEGTRSGEEIEEALFARYPSLYWIAHPPVELSSWRALCEWLSENAGPISASNLPEQRVEEWTALLKADSGERMRAYDLLSDTYRYARLLSVAPHWRERLAELERVAVLLR